MENRNVLARELNDALYRLLFSETYREAFLSGKMESLGLSSEAAAQLAVIDKDELQSASSIIVRDLLSGNIADSKSRGLAAKFPRTFAMLASRGVGLRKALSVFMESPEFLSYREVPFAGAGISIEEAFHRFLAAAPCPFQMTSVELAVAQHEFLSILLKILVASPDPLFSIGDGRIRRRGDRYMAFASYRSESAEAVLQKPAPGGGILVAYGATPAGFFCGRVPALTETLIEACWSSVEAFEQAAFAARHDVEPEMVARMCRDLSSLGMLPEGA